MKEFKVISISAEYATLLSTDGEELFIALALLPMNVDIGTRLAYENFEFKIL